MVIYYTLVGFFSGKVSVALLKIFLGDLLSTKFGFPSNFNKVDFLGDFFGTVASLLLDILKVIINTFRKK